MKYTLPDAHFPDIVAESAKSWDATDSANDNGERGWDRDDIAEQFLIELARIDIEATRAW